MKNLKVLFTVLCMLCANLMMAGSLVINTTNFTKPGSGSGYTPYNGTRTIDGIGIYSNQVMVQSSKIQFQKGNGVLYNTTAMPGNITKITFSTSNITIKVGTTQNPSAGTAVTSGSTISGSYTYFSITATSGGTPSAATITIEYGSTYTLFLYDATNGNTVGVSGKSGSHDDVEGRTAYSSLTSGTKLTLTNTPASGYQFDEWTVMDEKSGDLSSCLDGNQITMPAKDVYVYSSFITVSACNTKPTLGTTANAGSSTTSTVTLQWPNGIISKGEEDCEITSYGFVYGTGDNPALDGSGNAVSGYTKVEVGNSTPTLNQQITHTVEGLQSGTQVYFRFYATNAAGTTVSSTKGSAGTSSLQDHFFDNVQESDGYTGAGHTEYNAYTVPSLSDKTPATEGSCEQVHYHFVGWVSEANKSNPTDGNIIPAGGSTRATGANYYAVWAKEE